MNNKQKQKPNFLFVITYKGRDGLISAPSIEDAKDKAYCYYGIPAESVSWAYENDLELAFEMGYLPKGFVRQRKAKKYYTSRIFAEKQLAKKENK